MKVFTSQAGSSAPVQRGSDPASELRQAKSLIAQLQAANRRIAKQAIDAINKLTAENAKLRAALKGKGSSTPAAEAKPEPREPDEILMPEEQTPQASKLAELGLSDDEDDAIIDE